MTIHYKKSTNNGFLTNYLSFKTTSYKLGLVKTLVDRLYKINNTWSGFHNDIQKANSILQKNPFPPELIDKVVQNYFSHPYSSKKSLNKKEGCYFKLSYVRIFSRHTQNKMKRTIKKLCYDEVSVNIVFVFVYEIGSMFSTKDKIPSFLNSMVVYKFVYASCNACYEGEAAHHLPTRIKEHLKTDKSCIYANICHK